MKERFCPRCGESYTRPPAISRKDNRTEICPDCGVREALMQISLPEDRIEAVIRQLKEFSDEHT